MSYHGLPAITLRIKELVKNYVLGSKARFWAVGQYGVRRRRRVKGGMAAAASQVVREGPHSRFYMLSLWIKGAVKKKYSLCGKGRF